MTELERAQAELDSTRGVIDGILAGPGASYTVGTRTFTKLDLDKLYARERELLARVGRLTRGGIRIQQVIRL